MRPTRTNVLFRQNKGKDKPFHITFKKRYMKRCLTTKGIECFQSI